MFFLFVYHIVHHHDGITLFCRCKMSCFDKLAPDDFAYCIKKMNTFLSKNEQDIFLQQLIEKEIVKCHRPRKEGAVPRQHSFKYYIVTSSEKKGVCKKAFTSVWGITENRVRRLCSLLQQSQTPHDKRGLHPKANTTPPEVLKAIHDHILAFPRKQTHYSGKNIEYLDARLDIKTMHNLFKRKHPNLNITYAFYAGYFKNTFSLRFGRPQVDTCVTCEELSVKLKSPALGMHAKKAVEAELVVHKRRAKKFHRKINEVKDIVRVRDDTVALTFDFMQNLPLPHIPIQEVFYLRQLWVNCFGIKNLKTNESVFYVYHEGLANKGANEVCSMILHYLDTFLDGNVKELYLFSDNCPGQNKNHTVIRFLMSLTDTNKYTRITHYFPIRGHSFLPNDQDFGVVKKKIKKCDRIYVPDEYYSIMSEACEKFSVYMLSTREVVDFSNWWTSYYKRTCLDNESFGRNVPKEQKHTFAPSGYMCFQYDHAKKGVVTTQDFIDGLRKHTFNLGRSKGPNITIPVTKAYPGGSVPINPKKISDIQDVRNSIKSEHLPFYEKIFTWTVGEEQDHTENQVENDEEFDYVP